MTTDISGLASELHDALAAGGARRRVPDALRRRVVAAIAKHRASGGKAREVITALGLHEVTAYRWMRELREGRVSKKQRFSMVRVIPSAIAETSSPASTEDSGLSRSRGIVVTTRQGLRVDGLDLDALCTLIARIG